MSLKHFSQHQFRARHFAARTFLGAIGEAEAPTDQIVGPATLPPKQPEYWIRGVGNIESQEAVGRPTITEDEDELVFLLLAA